MRPIDADALIEYLEETRPLNWTDAEYEIQEQNDWNYFKRMINAFTTLRCQDCEQYKKEG